MHAQVLIYLHQLISGPCCKPISIQHLMESLSVRLAFRNACHCYRTRQQNFANKTSRINGVNSIDNDLMWNIQYRKETEQLSSRNEDIIELAALFQKWAQMVIFRNISGVELSLCKVMFRNK